MTTNDWCAPLGIEPPQLEAVAKHREAITYSLLLVALLERGEAMTLPEVAARFAKAGIADEASALASLKRCQPSRPPVYREGELYHLDPYDPDLDLWLFRLGLRPSKGIPGASIAENTALYERRRAAHAAELEAMSRALLVAFPPEKPRAVALLDVMAHEISTYVGDELQGLPARLEGYDIIGGIEIRGLLRALGFAPGQRRLHELGPPQKTLSFGPRGGSVKLTVTQLVQSSCRISRPFTDEAKLGSYLQNRELSKLRKRLEVDAQSLYALYEYGRLHGTVRLRLGPWEEDLPAPWAHPDEVRLHRLKKEAFEMGVPLEIVVGRAPAWSGAAAKTCLARVVLGENRWDHLLVDPSGAVIEDADVQRARLALREGGVREAAD